MIDALLRCFALFALSLRYRVRVVGLRAVAARGRSGVLFLPNHPALIDPIMLGAVLHRDFRARFLADKDQIDRFFVRYLALRANVVPIPAPEKFGAAARLAVEQALRACVAALREGDNLVVYPAGRLMQGRRTEVGAASAVEAILRELPDVRVVLVRTTGLWGSLFSHARGRVPRVSEALGRGIPSLLAGGLLGAPRRPVTIELREPADFPRRARRAEINAYLEAFYNARAAPATYVPYSVWEPPGIRELPDPPAGAARGSVAAVPGETRRAVLGYLAELSGRDKVRPRDHLAGELGLDSLARADLLVWLERQFGHPPGDVEAMQTAGDVILAAAGQSVSARVEELPPAPRRWFASPATSGPDAPVSLPPGRTIGEMFLAAARRRPGRAIVADAISGVRTYRDVVTGVLVLREALGALPGRRLGIMLPAGVAADVTYLATLFAARTPVMVNWTVGSRNLAHCLALTGMERVITAGALVGRLETQGVDLSPIRDRLVFLDRLVAGVPLRRKLAARVRSLVSWAPLDRAAAAMREGDAAAVLFTSGSEAAPKAVPLTHANILANVRGFEALREVRGGDRMMGILPPFHSFGLTVTTVLPLCMGVPVAHWPDPTAGAMIARSVEAYRATILIGTPTFLAGLLRAAAPRQLASLRLAITGADKCPDSLYDALAAANPHMRILEGYGVTECSPVVSVNRPGRERRGTIGEPLAGVEVAVVDADTRRPVAPGRTGVLLVAGPGVFGGYLGYDGASPFVEHDGRRWYITGDLVSRDADGVLTFRGRLKRFVKLGGEMISLPAVEAALAERFGPDADDRATVAVEAAPRAEPPEIVLFTTRELDRETANRLLREAGLSPLHNIRRVVRLDALPTLGTGKTDYRALRERLAEGTADRAGMRADERSVFG